MTRLVLASSVLGLLVACSHQQETPDEAFRRVTGHGMNEPEPARAERVPVRKARVEEDRTAKEAPPVDLNSDAGSRCARTRSSRVEQAKREIQTTNEVLARFKQNIRLAKWADDHKCRLVDGSGSVVITKTREPNGNTRIRVQRGRPDEIVCNTAKVPPELTSDLLGEFLFLDSVTEDDVLFSTFPECDDSEKPSLRVRYKDTELQKEILALP